MRPSPFEKARRLIERDGWCQNMGRYRGRRCLNTALCEAGILGSPSTYSHTANWFLPYLDIAHWNDAPGRTQEEVTDILIALDALCG